jgi:cell wall-associated NlpC family hydrolase
MKIKLSILILVLLISTSVQSGNRATNSDSEKSTNATMSVSRVDLIQFAKKLLGAPYRYASSNPKRGFDCSGFVNYVFKNFKINLPRGSRGIGVFGAGQKPEEFKVGDVLVFYGFKDKTRVGHVGIICEAAGMNSKFIHSSSGKGHGVMISKLGSDMYTRRFYKCIDVIN